jgi:hypothetical protein
MESLMFPVSGLNAFARRWLCRPRLLRSGGCRRHRLRFRRRGRQWRGNAARAIGWSSACAEKPEINNNAKENADNRRALSFIELGFQQLTGVVLRLSTGQSLVAVGHSDNALTRIALLAVFQGGEPGCFAVSAGGAARVFAAFIRRQRCAHCSTGANYDLAAGSPTVTQRHLVGTFLRVLVPARAIFTGLPIPGDRWVTAFAGRALQWRFHSPRVGRPGQWGTRKRQGRG